MTAVNLYLQPPSSLSTNYILIMESFPVFTQCTTPTSSLSAPIPHSLLEGDWPILGQTKEVPPHVIDRITSEGSGSAISSNISYFSLGLFLIYAKLLEPHPTQRKIDWSHVNKLKDDFLNVGILRIENPGVVIGLGEGWYQMKKDNPRHVLISPNCSHLDQLNIIPGGAIGQVLRGGHRTAAIKSFGEENPGHGFWYYDVLIPGKLSPLLVYY